MSMGAKKTLFFMLILTCIITTIHILWMSGLSAILYSTTGRYFTIATPSYGLYRYPLTSLMSVLPTLLLINSDKATELGWKVRVIIHFFLTFTFSFGSWLYLFSTWYGWNHLLRNVWQFLLVFTIIYIGAYQTFIHQQRALANKFNERIKERKFEVSIVDEVDVGSQ